MELQTLSIDGFRGLYTDLTFSHNTVIIAGNGKGKTTIMNALLWLLCGVDDADRSNYNLFDNKLPQDDPYAPLSVNVTAVFDTMVISRTATQSWGKDKNSGGYVRKGDEYKYSINDMEVSATRFKEIIETNIMPIDKLKFILNVHRWEIIGEQALRDKLKELADPSLKPNDSRYDSIMWAITENGVAGAKKHYAKRSKEYQQDAEKLNIEIMATRKRMPQVISAEELYALSERLAKAQSELDELNARIDASIPTEILQKRQVEEQEIYKLKSLISTMRVKYDSDNKTRLAQAEAHVARHAHLKDNLRYLRERIAELEERIKSLTADKDNKMQEYLRIQRRMFTGVCPTCGQDLVGNSRAEQLAAFKAQKAKEESQIIDEGKLLAQRIEELVNELEGRNKALAETQLLISESVKYEKCLEMAKRRCEIPFEDTEEYKQVDAQLAELEINRTEIPQHEASAEDKTRKGDLLTKIQKLQSDIAIAERDKDEYQRLETDLKRLETKREAVLRKVAENDSCLDLVKAYESEWMRMLEEEINSHWSGMRVQMNDVSKTGDVVDCCKIRMADVKDTLNNASRILVGLYIAEAFQAKYNTDLPIIIDECESIEECKIPNLPHQMIRFYVDQNGCDLRVENRSTMIR